MMLSKSKRYKIRNETMKNQCDIIDVVKFIKERRKENNNHA